MKPIHQLQRYYHTVKYLRSRQIVARFQFRLRCQFYRRFSRFVNRLYDNKSPHASTKSTLLLKGLDEFSKLFFFNNTSRTYGKTAKAILSNTFNFLNTEIRFDSQIDWHISKTSKLWRYHLHYFDYARDLGLFYQDTDCDKAYGKFKSLTLNWIAENRIGDSEGWEAYPVSLRMVNWFLALHLFSEKIITESNFYEQLLRNLFKHARFLEHNLEYHICGNHLIKNGKALTFAGLFFKGREADRWYEKGTYLLWEELQEQILADGGHFERSSMYHLIVLQDYLEVFLLLLRNNRDIPSQVVDKIKSMLGFLAKILQTDGNIPLLNDSAFGIATNPKALLETGNSLFGQIGADSNKTSFVLDSSGYYVMRDKSGAKYLIVDCGKICPDYLPPHAHCDTLSYELSIGNERIIVDSGVYEYASGAWRDFYRSTRAHNTIVVDGLEQSDVWGSFRAGRRAFPTQVKWIVKNDVTFFETFVESLQDKLIIFLKECRSITLVFDKGNNSPKNIKRVDKDLHFYTL